MPKVKSISPSPSKTRRLQIIIPMSLSDACEAAAGSHGEDLAVLVRRAMAREIGRPELADMRGRGQPRKPAE